MKKKDILGAIKMLAQSQGFYGRLLSDINDLSEEESKNFWKFMEEKNFKDTLDIVLFFEC